MTKNEALIIEASRWIGITEDSPNSSQLINKFQSIIGSNENEPWCMSFVQYCCYWVDKYFPFSLSGLYKSESCLQVWEKTNPIHRSSPKEGNVVIWNYDGTSKGHCGIIKKISNSSMITIEGNTSVDSEKSIVREGDGVFLKIRPLSSIGKFKILGYLNPWV